MQTIDEAFAEWHRERASEPNTEEFPAITDEFLVQYDRKAEAERKLDELVAWRWEAHEKLKRELALLVAYHSRNRSPLDLDVVSYG